MSICKSNKDVGERSWECIGFIEDLDGINVLVDVALRHQQTLLPRAGAATGS